jgi:predicted small metal-binding protein
LILMKCLKKRGADTKMMSFKCKDLGIKCGFEIKDENKDELLWVVAIHTEETHNLKRATSNWMDKIKKAIKQN